MIPDAHLDPPPSMFPLMARRNSGFHAHRVWSTKVRCGEENEGRWSLRRLLEFDTELFLKNLIFAESEVRKIIPSVFKGVCPHLTVGTLVGILVTFILGLKIFIKKTGF